MAAKGNGNGSGEEQSNLPVVAPQRLYRIIKGSAEGEFTVLYDCDDCPYNGNRMVEWTQNKRYCAGWYLDAGGSCWFQINRRRAYNLDQENTWKLLGMAETIQTLYEEYDLDLVMRRACGASTSDVQRSYAKIIEMIDTMLPHAEKHGLLSEKSVTVVQPKGGFGFARFCRELLSDPAAKRKFIVDFAATDSNRAQLLNAFFVELERVERSKENGGISDADLLLAEDAHAAAQEDIDESTREPGATAEDDTEALDELLRQIDDKDDEG